MDTVQKQEAVALGFPEMKRMLGPKEKTTRLMQYDDLQHVRSAEALFSGKIKAVVILLSIQTPDSPPVGHWIAMLDLGTHYEHFDPYGIRMDEELAITHEKPYLKDLFRQPHKRLIQSTLRLQTRRENVNTCGRHCIVRIRMGGELNDFSHFLRSAHTNPDAVVTLMTALL